ncbi:GNAT family N-acetyltransferase [Lutibacter sp. B2]|nr:GNAT family N-acetyltransferase [Lutibacter sp. B2]
MTLIQRNEVLIRSLSREDIDKMKSWGKHEDPLFFHYNFPDLNEEEGDYWYAIKNNRFRRKSFAIENEEKQVIGYLSIRDIRWMRRESELGIVLDPKQMNKGYGKKSILKFLEYYFLKMHMQSLKLRAAKYNERAMRCYQVCGFKTIGECYNEFEDQYAEIFYNPKYKDLKKIFKNKRGMMMTKYVHMKITKEDFCDRV